MSLTDKPSPWFYTPAPAHPARRWLVLLLLAALVAIFTWVVVAFHTNTHPGVDQNGYLVTARLLVEKGQLWYVTQDPYQFAGKMCITTDTHATPMMPAGTQPMTRSASAGSAEQPTPPPTSEVRYYAKYPFGYPLLAAVAYWIGGIDAMYWVNPLCSIAAVWMSYFLFRQALSPTMSLLGTLLLATNPLTIMFANDANSHASVLLCVIVGFWGLLAWWRTDCLWKGMLGALVLGYGCTIRYTEFLLILPVAFAVLANLKRTRRSWISSGLILLSWAVPVAVLAIVCWVHFGAPWRNGYSFCNEDTGFGWKYFIGDNTESTNPNQQGNWATLLQQLNHTGLFVFWPLALAGLMVALMRVWRLGMLLVLWVIPSMGLYMFYYWAPQGEQTIWYLRFFVDLVPGFIFAAMWLIERFEQTSLQSPPLALSSAAPVRESRGTFWTGLTLLSGVGLLTAFWIVCAYAPEIPANTGTWLSNSFSTQGNNWRYALAGGFILLLAAIYIWERKAIARVAPVTVAVGALVALACSVNLLNTLPQLGSAYTSYTQVEQNIRAVQAAAPSGAVLFANEQICDALDCRGGFQLYDTALFSNLGFNNFLAIYSRNLNLNDDPCPVQWDRARYYVQLLGHKVYSGTWLWNTTRDFLQKQKVKIDPKLVSWQRTQYYVEKIGFWLDPGAWLIKPPKERLDDQVAIFRRAAMQGQRLLVLRRTDDKNVTLAQLIPNVQGVSSKKLATWVNTPAVEANYKAWFVNQRGKAGQAKYVPPVLKWELYEIQVNLAQLSTLPPPTPAPVVPAKTPVNKPIVKPAVTTRPANTTTKPAVSTTRRNTSTRPAVTTTKPAATQPK